MDEGDSLRTTLWALGDSVVTHCCSVYRHLKKQL
jgi:hypothetical protein